MPGRFLIALSFVLSGSCFAQANVGDVIKLGAVKMTKEELQQLHAGGVTMKGALRNGQPYSQQNKVDGTIAGFSGPYSLSGTWKIDDSGKYCHDVSGSGGLRFNLCSIIWKADGRYFASPDDAPATEVRERQFVK